MAAFNDTVTTTITIDGKQAVNQIGALEMEVKDLNTALKSIKKGTQEYIDTNQKLAEVKKNLQDVRDTVGLTGMTIKQLREEQKRLNYEMNNITKGTAAYDEYKAKIQAVSKAINDQQADIKDTRTAWEKMKGSVSEFGAVAAGVVGGEIITGLWSALSGFVMNVTKGAADLADQFSDIQKTTGMTADEVKALNSEISKIDTRTSSKDLRDIAKVGGQIGIAKEEMLGFVESVNMASVALADEFTGGAEQVAKEIGTVKNLFQETKDMGAGEAISKIGSAMNALGSAGMATAPEIANFTQRLGTLGKLGPNIAQTMGLGAAMQELGLSAEISSGGLTSLFITAGQQSEAFAAQMGITQQAFKDLQNNDPNQMLIELAKSFQGLDNDQVVAALGRMKVGSQEAVKVMSLLANQTDLVREKQTLAAVEMEKNTSLAAEAKLKEENFAGQLAKTEKIINGFVASLSQGLIPAMTGMLATFVFVINAFKELPKFVEENKGTIRALAAALIAFNAQAIIANASMLLMKNRAVLVASGTKAWAAAQRILNLVLAANPIGLVVTAVSLLAVGLYNAYERAGTFTGALKGIWAMMGVLGEALGKFGAALFQMDFSGMVNAFKGVGEKMLYEFDLMSGKRLIDKQKENADKAKVERDKRIDDEQNERRKQLREWSSEGEGEAKATQEKLNKARADALAKGDSEATKARAEKLKKEKDEFDDFLKEIRQRSEDEMAIYMAQAGDINRIKFSTAKAKSNIQLIGEKNSAELAPEEAADPNAAFDRFNKNKKAGGELTLLKATASKNGDAILSAKKDLLAIEMAIELSATDLTENEKALIREKYRQREIELTKNAEMAKAQAAIEISTAGLDSAKAVAGAIFAVESGNAERSKREKLAKLDDEYKQGLISKQGYEAAKSDIEGDFAKKAAALKTKQAKAEKVAAIFQALISGAAAVVKALPNIPLSILAGVAAAASVASIIATPIPDFSGGSEGAGSGNAPTGGYYDGGATTRSPSDRTPVGIVHANEYVIPAGLLRKPEIANMAGVIESMRTGGRGFIEGGFTSPSAQTATSGLEAKLDRLITAIFEMANRPIKTYVVARDVQDELDDWNRIQDESRFG